MKPANRSDEVKSISGKAYAPKRSGVNQIYTTFGNYMFHSIFAL